MITGNKRERSYGGNWGKETSYGMGGGGGGTGLGSLGSKPRSDLFTFQKKTPKKTYGSRMHKSAIVSPPSRGAPKVKKFGTDSIRSPTGTPVATYHPSPNSHQTTFKDDARGQQQDFPLSSKNFSNDRRPYCEDNSNTQASESNSSRKLQYDDIPSNDNRMMGAPRSSLHSPIKQKDPSVSTETPPKQELSQRFVSSGKNPMCNEAINDDQETDNSFVPSNSSHEKDKNFSFIHEKENEGDLRPYKSNSLISQANTARKRALQSEHRDAPGASTTSSTNPVDITGFNTPKGETQTTSRFFSPLKYHTPKEAWHKNTWNDPLSKYSKANRYSLHHHGQSNGSTASSSFDTTPRSRVISDSEAACLNGILEKRPYRVGVGLVNRFRNSCFMNATVQCLAYSTWFLRWLHEYEKARNELSSKQLSEDVVDVNREVSFLIQRLHSQDSDTVIIPQRMLNALVEISRDFIPGRQQDAQEFFCRMLDTMGQHSARHGLPVCNIFEGKLISRVLCSVCDNASDTTDPFVTLSLGIHGCSSLHESLSYFFAAETLEGENSFECSTCASRVKAEKRVYFQTLPNILAIHFKRFHRFSNFGKDDNFVSYPEAFNVFDRLCPDRRKQHDDMTPNEESSLERRNCWYELSSILVHRGADVNSGHYYSLIRMRESGGKIKFWKIDDEHVWGVTEEGAMNQRAYMLFYERCSELQGNRWEHLANNGTIRNIHDRRTNQDSTTLEDTFNQA